jgi:hypothetical protein
VRNSRIYPGIIYATYPVDEVAGSRVTFEDSTTSGTLFKEELAALPEEGRKHFKVSVMVTAPFESERVEQAVRGASLNDCQLPAESVEQVNLNDRKYYPAFSVPTSCLRRENVLTLASAERLYSDDLILYGANERVAYSYLPDIRPKIVKLAALGLLELALGIGITILIYRRTGRQW